MAEKLRNLFGAVRSTLNMFTEDGVQKPEADYIDLMAKAVPLFDIAHKDLYEMARKDITKAEPTSFTSIEDTTEVNYKADQAMIYYCAARLAPFKKKELVQYFEDEWLRLRARCANRMVTMDIEDVYGINYVQKTLIVV